MLGPSLFMWFIPLEGNWSKPSLSNWIDGPRWCYCMNDMVRGFDKSKLLGLTEYLCWNGDLLLLPTLLCSC